MKWLRTWLFPDLEKQADVARHASWLQDQNKTLVRRVYDLECRISDLQYVKTPMPPQNDEAYRRFAALEHDYHSMERDFNALAAENTKNKRVADAFRELLELLA